jgi:hypothetical protein
MLMLLLVAVKALHYTWVNVKGKKLFLYLTKHHAIKTYWDGALGGSGQPPIQWVAGVKRPGREADHSPPSSAEVMNAWNMSSWRGA